MSEDFIPKMIGSKDEKAYENIEGLYQAMTTNADNFVQEIRDLLNDQKLSPESIFETLKKDKVDFALYLKRGFVNGHKVSIPGINTEKLINSDWLDLPPQYEEAINSWDGLNEILDQIKKTQFVYPLSKLYNSADSWYNLTNDFENELSNFTTRFTSSEMQNEVVEITERFCNVINDLIRLGMLKQQGLGWMNACQIMQMAIDQDENPDGSLSPNRRMFEKYFTFERFGTNKKTFEPNTTDRILVLN